MAPLNSKQVLTGFIDIPEDGFYFIYPLGNHLHERSQGHWRDSSIYPNTLRDSVLTAEGSSITIDVGKETLFNYTYPETDFNLSKGGRVHKSPPVRVIQRVELKKGKYPIKAVFSRVYLDGRGGGERFEGVNIMLHKSENARDVENLGFVYSNKRQARLTTFPLSDDTNQNALASNPRDVKYTDFQFDIKEETPLDKFSQQQGSFSLKHFKFTLKPEVAGPYYIGQDISTSAPRYKGTIFYDRNKNVNENRTGNFQCYINGTYEGEFGKKTFRDEGVWLKQGQEEALGRVGRGFNLYTTLLSGGSKLYLNVTPDMAGKDIDIEIKYYCNFSTFHDPYYFDSSFRNYIFTPLLKTPSNNSYKPLEYFAE